MRRSGKDALPQPLAYRKVGHSLQVHHDTLIHACTHEMSPSLHIPEPLPTILVDEESLRTDHLEEVNRVSCHHLSIPLFDTSV